MDDSLNKLSVLFLFHAAGLRVRKMFCPGCQKGSVVKMTPIEGDPHTWQCQCADCGCEFLYQHMTKGEYDAER